ncbi:MAG: hypothetical protein H7256_15395 [Bdellovibrio sp.]|nr:hypothetical protein [Bdellovibrio sp.]
MSQTKNPTFKKSLVVLVLSLLAVTSFSCAKKATGVRGQVKKTSQLNMNPGVTAQAEQTASAQKVLYKIASISTPVSATDGSGGTSVSFELLTPANQYLPFTTTHVAGALTRQGLYQDTVNNVQVSVQSKCTTADCTSYYLLVSVLKNNVAVFQTGAVSYANDQYFYGISVTNNFTSVDSLQSYVASTQYATPRNDMPATAADTSNDVDWLF